MQQNRNNLNKTENNVTFERSLGFFDATMIGVGAMIGAGIFVLTGIAAGEAGPASIIAFILNGFVTLLTAFAYAELASTIPQAGGGYSYIKHAFPDVLGFLAGIWLWFAYTIACSLYAAGFGHYFLEFFARYFPGTHHLLVAYTGQYAAVAVMTLFAGIGFIALNIKGADITGKAENIIVVAKVVVLVIFVVFGFEKIVSDVPAAKAEFTPFMPNGISGVFVAMGLTFIAFEGYDLIATVAEEIKDPEKNIPRATFVSLGVTIFIYLCVILVSLGAVHSEGQQSWEFLGKYQETAIVMAAENMMSGIGVFLIVMGGVLSTMSALNATVLASSRVAFSMARDGWLPERISDIHPKRRTPHIAITLTGIIFLIAAILLPIDKLGSAASIMFLLVFAMVNLALIALRRKQPNLPRPYRIPLYPAIPILGFAINMALAIYQLVFDPIPWIVVIGWTLGGLALYTLIYRKKIKQIGPQVLEIEKPHVLAAKERYRVLVPLANPHTVERMISIAAAIAKPRGGEIIAHSVVLVPLQVPIHDGMRLIQHQRPLIRQAKACAAKFNVDLTVDLRVAHSLRECLIHSVKDNDPDLLIMGWKGYTDTKEKYFGEIMDYMIRHCPCDLMVMKEVPGEIRNILLATAGGPHATLGASFASNIAQQVDGSVDTCVVVPRDADKEIEKETVEQIKNSIDEIVPGNEFGQHVERSDSIGAGIVRAARDFDMVVIGASPSKPFKYTIAGEIPEKVLRYSNKPVLLVRHWEGPVVGLFRKLFG